jgi:hypothetical protein
MFPFDLKARRHDGHAPGTAVGVPGFTSAKPLMRFTHEVCHHCHAHVELA